MAKIYSVTAINCREQIMSNVRDKVNQRMNVLQHWMESNYHMKNPNEVLETVKNVTKFWSILSEEDRDYIDGINYAIENKMEWFVK